MIKLVKSTFYDEKETKKKLVDFITSSDILSFNKECLLFEKNFAKYQGRKHCVFMSSGSTANFALIQALKNLGKIKEGDIAAFSAVTWSTNVMPLLQLGLKVLPVDVEMDTLNVSSKLFIESPLSTKILFITNLLGFCDDIDQIAKICEEKNIILIEDNCESLGTIYKNKKLGNFGLASTFSFFVGHHMSTIEGGAVCTDDDELAVMLKLVRAHGWDRNMTDSEQEGIRKTHKINSPFYAKYTFYDLGNNFRPNEINGFLGNIQLPYLDEITKRRRDNFTQFVKTVNENSERYYPIRFDHIDFLSNFAVPVICKSKKILDTLIGRCEGKLEIRPVVGGNMTSQPFMKKYNSHVVSGRECKNANYIHTHGLYFANNPELNQKEIDQIIDIVSSK
jgi:CDP-4-dehydro-6-deoxyglucose reductase, E1